MTRYRLYLDNLRSSYWFVPAVMSIMAFFIALALSRLDASIPNEAIADWGVGLHLPVDNVSSFLTTISVTAISVLGVIFSVSLVPLTIASSQFGPIILRRFLRDEGIQVVLGTFCATITFSLATTLFLPPGMTEETIPSITLTVTLYLFLVSLALLVYFIHHVAWSLQASNVIAELGEELEQVIDAEMPPPGMQVVPASEDELHRQTEAVQTGGRAIIARRSGYVRAIAYEDIIALAAKRGLTVLLNRQPGDFVVAGDTLAWVAPAELVDRRVRRVTATSYLLGEQRTMLQDIEFGLSMPVVIAVRALSPAINDPFTASASIDRLAAGLSIMADRGDSSPYRSDGDGVIRIIYEPVSFDHAMDVAFDAIREYGRGSTIVLLRLLEALQSIAAHSTTRAHRRALLRHADLIEQDSRIGLKAEYDLFRIREAYEETLQVLNAAHQPVDLS